MPLKKSIKVKLEMKLISEKITKNEYVRRPE